MALEPDKLYTQTAGANQIHHYVGADTAATIIGAGYFNSLTNRFKKGDIIFVVGSAGGTPTLGARVVTSATGAAVVTTAALA